MPVEVVGDEWRLRQVLTNLISNAIRFTLQDQVYFEVARLVSGKDTARLRFSVTDTGIGIPAEKLAAIFDNFTQVDPASSRQQGGTGLGLAISIHLAEMMGGTSPPKAGQVTDRPSVWHCLCGLSANRWSHCRFLPNSGMYGP